LHTQITVIGLLLYVAGYIVYYRQFSQNESSPRIATWFQWATLCVLNAFSYHSMCDGDWIKTAQSFLAAIGNIAIFLIVLKRNKFAGLMDDFRWLIIGLALIILWRITNNPVLVNILLQACIVVSAIPTFKAVIRNPRSEKWPAWILIGSSFIFMLYIAIDQMTSIFAVLYPLNGLVTNLAIGFLSLRKTKIPI